MTNDTMNKQENILVQDEFTIINPNTPDLRQESLAMVVIEGFSSSAYNPKLDSPYAIKVKWKGDIDYFGVIGFNDKTSVINEYSVIKQKIRDVMSKQNDKKNQQEAVDTATELFKLFSKEASQMNLKQGFKVVKEGRKIGILLDEDYVKKSIASLAPDAKEVNPATLDMDKITSGQETVNYGRDHLGVLHYDLMYTPDDDDGLSGHGTLMVACNGKIVCAVLNFPFDKILDVVDMLAPTGEKAQGIIDDALATGKVESRPSRSTPGIGKKASTDRPGKPVKGQWIESMLNEIDVKNRFEKGQHVILMNSVAEPLSKRVFQAGEQAVIKNVRNNEYDIDLVAHPIMLASIPESFLTEGPFGITRTASKSEQNEQVDYHKVGQLEEDGIIEKKASGTINDETRPMICPNCGEETNVIVATEYDSAHLSSVSWLRPDPQHCEECDGPITGENLDDYLKIEGSLDKKAKDKITDSLPLKDKKANKLSDKAQSWVSHKIQLLMDKGKSQDQAIAEAMSMARKKGFDVPEKKSSLDKQAKYVVYYFKTDEDLKKVKDKLGVDISHLSTSEGSSNIESPTDVGFEYSIVVNKNMEDNIDSFLEINKIVPKQKKEASLKTASHKSVRKSLYTDFDTIEDLRKAIKNQERLGDFIRVEGIPFQMVEYSMESVEKPDGGQASRWVTYYNPNTKREIAIDYAGGDIVSDVENSGIDWSHISFDPDVFGKKPLPESSVSILNNPSKEEMEDHYHHRKPLARLKTAEMDIESKLKEIKGGVFHKWLHALTPDEIDTIVRTAAEPRPKRGPAEIYKSRPDWLTEEESKSGEYNEKITTLINQTDKLDADIKSLEAQEIASIAEAQAKASTEKEEKGYSQKMSEREKASNEIIEILRSLRNGDENKAGVAKLSEQLRLILKKITPGKKKDAPDITKMSVPASKLFGAFAKNQKAIDQIKEILEDMKAEEVKKEDKRQLPTEEKVIQYEVKSSRNKTSGWLEDFTGFLQGLWEKIISAFGATQEASDANEEILQAL